MVLFETSTFDLGVELPIFGVDAGTGCIKEPAHREEGQDGY